MKYLVIDIGTGNVRVALTDTAGSILKLESDFVRYQTDASTPHGLGFDPEALWEQILRLASRVLEGEDAGQVAAVTSSSQREGIVVLDADGKGILGMPNIDHRGREYTARFPETDRVYQLSGRYPTSLFSVYKLIGLRERYPEAWKQTDVFLSLSDWALFKCTGQKGYEHSQASETLLYDVEQQSWSAELCSYFGIPARMLPPLVTSGSFQGTISGDFAARLGLNRNVKAVVGGADTQLAVMSTLPSTEDVVLVSGTTTPVIKIAGIYVTDPLQRTWTNSHTLPGRFILETNAGVTGLNYQRLKSIFYPNETYQVMEKEVETVLAGAHTCYAALGSLLAGEKKPLLRGGFVFPTPLSHELTRGHFTMALLWDMACSIYENYRSLCEVTPHREPYVWACGGGMQSGVVRQFLANLLDREVRVRENYRQATVTGCAFVCNGALEIPFETNTAYTGTFPDPDAQTGEWYQAWRGHRDGFKVFNK